MNLKVFCSFCWIVHTVTNIYKTSLAIHAINTELKNNMFDINNMINNTCTIPRHYDEHLATQTGAHTQNIKQISGWTNQSYHKTGHNF